MIPDYAVRLLRALPDAAVFVSATGDLLAANAAAREALGIGPGPLVDCNLETLLSDPKEKLAETLRSWAKSTEPSPGSFTRNADSEPKTFNGKGSLLFPLSDEGPAIVFVRFWPREEANPFMLLNQQVTQLNDEIARRIQTEDALRRSEASLRERATEAEALNRTKDEFLATVSHELRTPLNAILGWASLLRERPADAELPKAIEVIYRNAQSQARLIEDILDVSRIITGKLLLETQPADLVAIIKDAAEVVRPSATAKQIEIALVLPAEGCLLVADPDRLRQVVWNLLSNAVKFTDRGGDVRVTVHRQGSQVNLSVADTGKGIDPSFVPFVFDRFKQADSSTTRRVGGLGLGLALVRHIVELHGGAVEAFSDGLGKGATFTLTLPIRAVALSTPVPPPPDSQTERPRPASAVLRGVRILVVDDESDARDLLATVLLQAGAEVEPAGSVSEALNVLPQFRPDVLVSDIGMPEEDGYSFIRRLRGLPQEDGGTIPSIALTAYTRAEDRRKALAAGFTAHIGKPVDPDDLVSVIAGLAGGKGG